MIFTTGRYLPVGFMRAVEEYLCGLMCSLEFSAEGVECLQCISIQQTATELFSRFKQHLPFTRPISKPKLLHGERLFCLHQQDARTTQRINQTQVTQRNSPTMMVLYKAVSQV